MGDEAAEIDSQLEQLAEKALVFQTYVLRRAWGVYYSVWSFAVSFWIILPVILGKLYPDAPSTLYFVLYSLIGMLAGSATARIFSNAWRTLALRRIIRRERKRPKRILLYRFWWIPIYAIMIFAFVFERFYFYTLFLLLLTSVDIMVYYELKISFSRLPFEGLLAIVSYAVSLAIGLYSSLISNGYLFFVIAWAPMVISWFICSLYALYHAPESLVK